MKGSSSWSESPANVRTPPLPPPTSLEASSDTVRSAAHGGTSDSDTECLIPPNMGSSSCCRANHVYEKVPSLGFSQCVQSSTDDSLAVYVHVRTSTGANPLYAPDKVEQQQRHASRDAQIRSSSTRRDLSYNLPQHVRSRPHDDPLPHNHTSSSRKHVPHENCVQPPPNRSPFTPNTTFSTRLNSYSSSSCGNSSTGSNSSGSSGFSTTSTSSGGSSNSGSSSSSRTHPTIRTSNHPPAPAVARYPGCNGKKAI